MKDGQPEVVRRSEYRPPSHTIADTQLTFELGEGTTQVTAQLRFERSDAAPDGATDLRLDGQELELVSVAVDGRALASNEYRLDDESLTLFDLPAHFELSVVTRIHPEVNTALDGLYKSGGMYCTQCEAEGFRKITYYLDRPDILAPFTTTIVASRNYPVLLSNGNQIDAHELADGRRSVTWRDPFPKPSYLFALVAGDLAVLRDEFVTTSGRKVELRIYSEPHNIAQCRYAMGALQRAMRWDEQVYGREYDLDIFMIVAVEDFNMGAMENKGLNIFNTSCVLASADTATDAAYQRVEGVVAHEYFHNWSGNRVTCRDWFQLSLKEGFTVFRDAQFSADMHSRTVKRIEDVNFLRTFQFPEDAGPLAHPIRPDSYIEISNFYTTTVYEKGAEVVRMIHTLLGPARFRRGTDLYFDRHDGAAVTTEEFIAAMEAANAVDLGQFRRWYSQAGTPVVAVRTEFAGDTLTVHFEQRCPATPQQPHKDAFHIPIALGLLDAGGAELLGAAGRRNGSAVTLTSDATIENPGDDGTLIVHLRQPSAQVTIAGLHSEGALSLLRGFSAPVNLQWHRSSETLAFIAQHDTDGVCRWDAMQTLFAAEIDRLRTGAVEPSGEFLTLLGELATAAHAAADDGEAKAMFAVMLTVPSEAYLGELMEQIDVDGLHRARVRLREVIGLTLFDSWLALYRGNSSTETYQPDGRGIARRALRNLALSYICATGDSHVDVAKRVVLNQYEGADNLTERLAALREIINAVWLERSVAAAALDGFAQRWQHEKLVMDQWFALQAACPAPDALQRVMALDNHPDFDARNPNRVRSLYGVFAQQNVVRFHASDGSGYRFLTERVSRLDRANPQLAARLLAPLTRWRRYDAARRLAMRDALRRIEADAALSKDVFEVVSKSLQTDG